MNLLKIYAFIFKFGGCYALWNYAEDPVIQAGGIFFFIGICLTSVDELENGNIMNNNKGVENDRRN